MRANRREFLIAGAAGALGVGLAAGCTPAPSPVGPAPGCPTGPLVVGPSVLPPPGSTGLVDEAVFQARTTEYLQLATQSLRPNDTASVIAHLLRAERDPGFTWDPSQVGAGIVSTDPYRDTDDFELMYQQWTLRLGRGVLPQVAIDAIEDKIANARYRYDDPLPPGDVDDKWFWSENHRIMFAVDEYLGGLALPDRVFSFTGLTGAQHAERARPVVIDWIRERSKFGYSEWHSNTYMKYDYAPLLTLVQWADDPELIALGAAATDVCLFDLATHTFRGVYGVTHGRGYKAAKTNGRSESSFSTAKFLFDTTDESYSSTTDHGVLFLCGNDRYRLPEVIERAARHDGPVRIRERHGVHLDPHEPWSPDPVGAYGYDYTTENLNFWWSHGALTAWQFIPPTLEACNRWNLWDSELFQKFAAVRDFAGIDPTVAQLAVRELAPFAAAGVLGEAHTYTWRSSEAMLSCVVDHRFGDAMEQVHAWQATLGTNAMVFTTHPSSPVKRTTSWNDDSGYWVGTASMPRSAQRDRAAIHIYQPGYAAPTDPLLGPYFGYEPYTHAYFPLERFDDVVGRNGWVFGRKGDGYVALWSHRPTTWRTYDPAVEATDGMTGPFDLLAPGGPDNVWIVEVGGASEHGSFEAFVDAVSSATVEVVGIGGERTVRYVSPTEGELRFGVVGAFRVDGVEVPLRDHPRHSSPWAEQCAVVESFDIRDGDRRLVMDTTTAGRVVS